MCFGDPSIAFALKSVERFSVCGQLADTAAVLHHGDSFEPQPLNKIFRPVYGNSICVEAHVTTIVQLIREGPAASVRCRFHSFHLESLLKELALSNPSDLRSRYSMSA